MLIKWLKKKMGYHVCETFTKWEVITTNYERPATMEEHIWANADTVTITRTSQKRHCTECGYAQVKSLNNF